MNEQFQPLNPREASIYLMDYFKVSRTVDTLAKLRVTGGSPAFIKIGRNIYYPVSEIHKWVRRNTVFAKNTSQTSNSRKPKISLEYDLFTELEKAAAGRKNMKEQGDKY